MSKCSSMTTAEYAAHYRQEHPDRVERYRLNQYARHLQKAGYTVIPPTAADRESTNEVESK